MGYIMTSWRNTFFSRSPISIGISFDFSEIYPLSVSVPSLYLQLQPYEIGEQPLPKKFNLLSEETIKIDDNDVAVSFNWSAGAREGLILYRRIGASLEQSPSDKDCEQFALLIYSAIKKAILLPDKENVALFYTLICQDKLAPITYLPYLINKIEQDDNLINNRLYFQLILWLLYKSPNKNTIKISLGLLSLFRDGISQRLLFLFALHPEFTLYSLYSIKKRVNYQNISSFFDLLGPRTKDWGRIQFIEYLPAPLSISTRYWLLTEGYKNNVMIEYVAYNCATKGKLLEILNTYPEDPQLLLGCSDILRALLNGGPTKDIYDYAQGPQVCLEFINQVNQISPKELNLLHCVCEIADFVQNSGEDWLSLGELGWSDYYQQQIMSLSQHIIQKPQWSALIIKSLQSHCRTKSYQASLVAKAIHLDIWELLFSLQECNPNADWWHHLMQTDSSYKIEKVVKLAEQQINISASHNIDTSLINYHSEYKPHHAVEYIMQDLRSFPGIGWSLIKKQLHSPILRNRNMALNVLSAWSGIVWPHDLYETLTQVLTIETDKNTHQRIRKFLANHQ